MPAPRLRTLAASERAESRTVTPTRPPPLAAVPCARMRRSNVPGKLRVGATSRLFYDLKSEFHLLPADNETQVHLPSGGTRQTGSPGTQFPSFSKAAPVRHARRFGAVQGVCTNAALHGDGRRSRKRRNSSANGAWGRTMSCNRSSGVLRDKSTLPGASHGASRRSSPSRYPDAR